MPSFILDLVKFNENVDYLIIIPLVLGYIFLFWFVVSIWVYIDCRKRISKKRYGLLFFFLNLIFGIPFLLLYLLARPYDYEESEHVHNDGGINIPVVNFMGKDGVVISLELKMDPSGYNRDHLNSGVDANYKVDVSLDTKNTGSFEIKDPQIKKNEQSSSKDLEITHISQPSESSGKINGDIKKTENLFHKIKKYFSKIKKDKKLDSNKAEIKKTNISFPEKDDKNAGKGNAKNEVLSKIDNKVKQKKLPQKNKKTPQKGSKKRNH